MPTHQAIAAMKAEAGGIWQRADRVALRVVGGMPGKALEPDDVGIDQVIEGAEDGAEEGLAVGAQHCRRQLARGLVDAAVHGGVVRRH